MSQFTELDYLNNLKKYQYLKTGSTKTKADYIDDDNCFYSVARKIRTERSNEEENEKSKLLYKAEQTFSIFRAWCLANYPIIINGKIDIDRTKNEVFTNLELFKEFCIKENINFWIKKELLEKHFNLKFEFNHKTVKWLKVKTEV